MEVSKKMMKIRKNGVVFLPAICSVGVIDNEKRSLRHMSAFPHKNSSVVPLGPSKATELRENGQNAI